MKTNSDLLKKYNVPGPRYTSYPTVPYWSENPTAEQWIAGIGDALDEGKKQGIGAALYIHIPFCEALCTYCGCNTRITRNHSVGQGYVESVIQEWELYLARLGRDISVSELHLGGGTPTFLSPDELERLFTGIFAKAAISRQHEFSVEADPRVTTRDHLSRLAKLGFRRLSLGIQDFDPRVQDVVNRIQTPEQVRRIVDDARELGFESINYDLIYGLPYQTRSSIQQTIDVVREQRPDRIAFYAYAHVPWIKPSQRRFTEADLPAGDEKRALYELGREMLEAVGYREIGMDHFALETDSLWQSSLDGSLHRNFMGYASRQVAPLIGLGVSAIGDSWSAFAQNEKLVETYQARVAAGEIPIYRGHRLDREDQVLRRHVLQLMTRFKTEWNTAETYTEFLETVPERLSELGRDGLVELSGRRCAVTEVGRAYLRNICMAFDARLVRQAPATQLFSKTI
jgi:oxygen-independent coproporphyrinogen-3 oxidase